MEYQLTGSVYTVTVTSAEVSAFAESWPGFHGDTGADYVFEFDARNGDLVDVAAYRGSGGLESISEEEDGQWLSALSDDACLAGADAFSLDDVLAIRFQITRSGMALA